jgi:hypothetical protein
MLERVRLPKPATRWLPQVLLFASRIVVSVANASQIEAKLACIRLNSQLRKHSRAGRLARLPAPAGLSRLTKGVVEGFFTLNARIAFGHGCDRPNYVAPVYSRSVPQGQPYSPHSPQSSTTCVRLKGVTH